MRLLTEIERIQSIMGVIKEDETNLQMNINLGKTVEILKYLRLYNKSIEKMLMEITVLSKNQIIDFGLLERGLRKILLKKGDKKKGSPTTIILLSLFSLILFRLCRDSFHI